MATRDATTKESGGNEEILPAMRSWSVDFDSMVAFDDTKGYEELRALINGRTEVYLVFTSTEAGDPRWSGQAYLTSISMDAALEDTVTMSGSFKGTGELTAGTKT
jgi:predicted secreted protein